MEKSKAEVYLYQMSRCIIPAIKHRDHSPVVEAGFVTMATPFRPSSSLHYQHHDPCSLRRKDMYPHTLSLHVLKYLETVYEALDTVCCISIHLWDVFYFDVKLVRLGSKGQTVGPTSDLP